MEYGCETWSLTVREKRRIRVFGKMVMRGIFGQKESGENYVMRSSTICTAHPVLFG
jgi:hypothetical protein